MKKYRYTNTDCFKVGEEVWVTGFKLYPSGRVKYSVMPFLCRIREIKDRYITLESTPSYYCPTNYYLDSPENNGSYYDECSLNKNIAKTKEEAIENYNSRVIQEIENKYKQFRNIEASLKSRLL